MNKESSNRTFEEIKHIDENGGEYWYARELMSILEYSNWQNFQKTIDKAIISCKNSDISDLEHFTDVSKTIKMPKGAEKEVIDYKLSRYACYLIAQNSVHYEMGKKVRKAIQDMGGVMPEELPTPSKSLKDVNKNKSLT